MPEMHPSISPGIAPGIAPGTAPGAASEPSHHALPKVLIFAERMLPSTQTFIPLQVNALTRYTPLYAGLVPADRNFALPQPPVLLAPDRSRGSRLRRELYRWTGLSPNFHAALADAEPQLIHAHFAEGASAAVSLSKQLNLPLVHHLRGGAELLADAELRRHPFQWPFLAYRRHFWARTSLFLCVSHYIRDKALRAGFPADKLRVHYTGMHTAAFTPTAPLSAKDPNLVLYVGRLVPYKGCDYLLRAMHLVQQRQVQQKQVQQKQVQQRQAQQRQPLARLVIIGDGTFRPQLERLNHELGVHAEFLGELPQASIRTWLEQARIFCGPSVTLSDGMSEAFGNVFSEAQAMGVPVVSFRHGGIPETMQEGVTGLLGPERDVDQLAANLLRFLEDDGFWLHAREAGMAWVRQNFDVHTQTARLEALYDAARRDFNPGSFRQAPPHAPDAKVCPSPDRAPDEVAETAPNSAAAHAPANATTDAA